MLMQHTNVHAHRPRKTPPNNTPGCTRPRPAYFVTCDCATGDLIPPLKRLTPTPPCHGPLPNYQVTLLGLWMMPAIFSLHLKFWRFLIVWTAFSAVTLYLLYLCAGKKKVDKDTPRKVRIWIELGKGRKGKEGVSELG